MRDELLLQVMLRCDSNKETIQRVMWMTLICLLIGFTPSDLFESHLEKWLLDASHYCEITLFRDAAEKCLNCMHESIILYGNNRRLMDTVNNTSLQIIQNYATEIDNIWNVEVSIYGVDGVPSLYSANVRDTGFNEGKEESPMSASQSPELHPSELQPPELLPSEPQLSKPQPSVLSKILDDSDDSDDEEGGSNNEGTSINMFKQPEGNNSSEVKHIAEYLGASTGLPDTTLRAWAKK